MIVDDDDEFRDMLVDALRFEGFTVDSVRDGQEGVQWLREHEEASSLVLLDWMMPVMDGKAFLDLRAADPLLAKVPVIMLTANGDCEQLKASGTIADCLSKTARLAEVVDAIASCP